MKHRPSDCQAVAIPPCYAPMVDTLSELLRLRRATALIEDVEFVRQFPACEERTEAAGQLIRHALLEHAVRRITDEQRDQILRALAFAIDRIDLPVELPDLNRLPGTPEFDARLP